LPASSESTPEDARWPGESGSPRSGEDVGVNRPGVYRMVVVAYIIAFSMPPIGFLLGLILAVRYGKPTSRHGIMIIGVSIVAGIIWAAIIAGGALNTPTTDF
jgi:hypothetical protein